jgi:hypothetical protein
LPSSSPSVRLLRSAAMRATSEAFHQAVAYNGSGASEIVPAPQR